MGRRTCDDDLAPPGMDLCPPGDRTRPGATWHDVERWALEMHDGRRGPIEWGAPCFGGENDEAL